MMYLNIPLLKQGRWGNGLCGFYPLPLVSTQGFENVFLKPSAKAEGIGKGCAEWISYKKLDKKLSHDFIIFTSKLYRTEIA